VGEGKIKREWKGHQEKILVDRRAENLFRNWWIGSGEEGKTPRTARNGRQKEKVCDYGKNR
jgi:hypothetical protein